MSEGLVLRGVHSGYRPGVTVVDDVSFDVSRGAVGIIGRNGAGKTCLAQAISGALPVTMGSVSLGGRDLTSLGSRGRVRHGLSLVPEGRLVFGQLTVRENLVVAAHAAGRKTTKIPELESLFPILGQRRNALAASMSGGEQQLLAIARALVQDPTVIVLDEPTLGLSPIAVDHLVDSLQAIIDDLGVCLVLMEQNAELLRALCHDVLLLDQGSVRQTLDMSLPEDEQALYDAYLGRGT